MSDVYSLKAQNIHHWKKHVIDNTSFGADGTKLGYADRDTLPDIVTGWEQGQVARLYFNPGPEKTDSFWPFVEVPSSGTEDAFSFDIDYGFRDMVTLSEDKRQRITFHWAPLRSGEVQKLRILAVGGSSGKLGQEMDVWCAHGC